MSKKRKKSVPVALPKKRDPYHAGTIDAITVTRAHLPRYNGFLCRGGVHGDTRYNRERAKAETARIIDDERA